MAMPYGLGEEELVPMRRTAASGASQMVDDWSVIPESCNAPMVDNGDGTWTVPQMAAACAIPICHYMFDKQPAGHVYNRNASSVEKPDYPWHGGGGFFGAATDEPSEAMAIADWYLYVKGHKEAKELSTMHFLLGIMDREGWLAKPTPIRGNKITKFEIPQNAEVPTTPPAIDLPNLWGEGTMINDVQHAMQVAFDPLNIVRFLGVAIGVGLVLFGAHKLA